MSESAARAVAAAVESGIWGDVEGPRKVQFEQEFAAFHDSQFGLGVSNGTVSLQIAMAALGVRSGDEVIVPTYTFMATAAAALAVNGTPIFVDVDPETATMDPQAVEAAITPRTKAIIPVHYAGHPADMDALMEISTRTGIPIIEDAAQAVGARWNGKAVGSMGAFGSFSFQNSKNLTSGEGGALTMNDQALADLAWSLHNCGRVRGGEWYGHTLNGSNHRLTELQSALLLDQLALTDDRMTTRTANAHVLGDALASIPGLDPLKVDSRVTRHGYHLYCIRFDEEEFGISRDAFLTNLRAEGIPAFPGYGTPLNRQPLFANQAFDIEALRAEPGDPRLEYGSLSFPGSEKLCKTMVIIPQWVLLGPASDVLAVAEAAEKIHRLGATLS
ncbi:MAG: DegT/DnrJ/EryC1/StrS family aminotransferase [Pseudolysinimonas sp.]